ncbi:MAG TPA: hypothetical protein VEC56_04680 [Candidatus Krumholzibacteria bacterium]|nr:hypothetical protein [Candidatus Krumholzibacteria bacterium]
MSTGFRLLVAACVSLSVLPTCSEQITPSAPVFSLSSSSCTTDLDCPLGQECVDGTCVPLRRSIFPHVQTGVVLLRAPVGDEIEWCATHYDVMIGAVRPDEMRALNPSMRFFDYTLSRYHTFDSGTKTAAEWAIARGWDPEDFYLHYEEDVYVPTWEGTVIVPGFPPGMVPGWNPGGGANPASASHRSQSRAVGFRWGNPALPYFANVSHPGYRLYFLARTTGLVDGSWYFNQPFATGPLEGVLCDEAVYYPAFGEGLLDRTVEYYGIPLTDNHPYAVAVAGFYPALAAALRNTVGTTVDVMPNFGHVLFLNYPNPSAMTIQTTTPWILGEVWVTFTGLSSPTSGPNRCITYENDYVNAVRDIVEQTRARGRRVLGARDLSNGTSGSDRGRVFTLSLFYLLYNPNSYYVYETVDQSSAHVSAWSWNPLVEFDVGRPATIPPGAVDFEGRANTREHWVLDSGPDPYRPDLTYRVLARRFTNALVLVKMLPMGSVDDSRSVTTHPLDRGYRVLQADGTLGLSVTEARLRNNEALILVPDVATGVD